MSLVSLAVQGDSPAHGGNLGNLVVGKSRKNIAPFRQLCGRLRIRGFVTLRRFPGQRHDLYDDLLVVAKLPTEDVFEHLAYRWSRCPVHS